MIDSVKDLQSKNRQHIDSETARQDLAIPDSFSLIKHKYLVTSNKRGVGKTSLAANLAITLSTREVKVGLIDLDLLGKDILKILGFKRSSYEIDEDERFIPKSFSDHLKVISIKPIIKDVDQAVIWKADSKARVIRQIVADIDWGKLDFLIVNSPPGTGNESFAVTQVMHGAKAIFISTTEKEPLPQITELIKFYQTAQIPILGVIENMSGFICKDCDRTGGSTYREAIIMEINYLGRIPIDPHMADYVLSDQSFLEKYPDSQAKHGYEIVVDKIIKDSRS